MLKRLKKRLPIVSVLLTLSGVFIHSCIEPFDTEGIVNDFESALVIEATITNELKQHQIRLTRAFELEADSARAEREASVAVFDDQGSAFQFSEIEPGLYQSNQVFQAEGSRNYQLSIMTSDGRNYTSDPAQLTQETQIESVEAARITDDDGNEGMAILVNSFDPTNNSNLYRYEYEETFLIIAPDWTDTDLVKSVPNEPDNCTVDLVFTGENDERICYGTNASNTIILTNTNGLDEDRVSRLQVRFINRNNFILSHRYSILVRQFVQSPAAHTFYTRLQELSQSDDLFSQTQTGLLVGNVFSEEDEDEIVLGYFEVSSVSEQRIFFNYEDFFPGEDLPPYAINCNRSAPSFTQPSEFGFFAGCLLSELVAVGAVEYVGPNNGEIPPFGDQGVGPHIVVPAPCGDCTQLGSNIRPSFWVD
ncbi:DUF4249 domain-containing protein [Flagellimonas meridianipacifica]|uniref:Uncharacterized protein DUF4249 n=1 Tax=Flagellimonas meridianipacifica TaxID=1080225 RepID=A0A2T0MB34_9FLAO|nr:DUF4249 domain-containing protein [Allomuricauda pacifica]PRX54699.1 uncharacterized protein DUF4249 [Allomuricauda pacifica]